MRERAEKDPNFATALMNEAVSSFLNGEPETARLILRELVNSTIGKEILMQYSGHFLSGHSAEFPQGGIVG